MWCRGLRGELSNIFDFMFYGYGVRVLWNPFFRFFFRFVTHISISLMIFMLNYPSTHILFSLRILLLAVEMSDRQAFDRKPDELLSRTVYRFHVSAHVILKVREEDARLMYYTIRTIIKL